MDPGLPQAWAMNMHGRACVQSPKQSFVRSTCETHSQSLDRLRPLALLPELHAGTTVLRAPLEHDSRSNPTRNIQTNGEPLNSQEAEEEEDEGKQNGTLVDASMYK